MVTNPSVGCWINDPTGCLWRTRSFENKHEEEGVVNWKLLPAGVGSQGVGLAARRPVMHFTGFMLRRAAGRDKLHSCYLKAFFVILWPDESGYVRASLRRNGRVKFCSPVYAIAKNALTAGGRRAMLPRPGYAGSLPDFRLYRRGLGTPVPRTPWLTGCPRVFPRIPACISCATRQWLDPRDPTPVLLNSKYGNYGTSS